jgi:hypothetical protein
LELLMIDRQLVGDVILAALLAIPTVALARPESVAHARAAAASIPGHNSMLALASIADRQVGIFR